MSSVPTLRDMSVKGGHGTLIQMNQCPQKEGKKLPSLLVAEERPWRQSEQDLCKPWRKELHRNCPAGTLTADLGCFSYLGDLVMVALTYQSCFPVASNTFLIATEMNGFNRWRCCVQILSWPLKTTRQFHRPPVSTHSGPGYNFSSTGAQRKECLTCHAAKGVFSFSAWW